MTTGPRVFPADVIVCCVADVEENVVDPAAANVTVIVEENFNAIFEAPAVPSPTENTTPDPRWRLPV
jgi:hypothetical protein